APDYFQPSTLLPLPLNPNLPAGGPYAALSFVYYEYTNPLKPQSIGFSGFIVTNPDVGSPVGTVIGSGIERLNVQQVTGMQYTPGFKIDLGYRFQDESTLSLSWTHLFQTHKSAAATFAVAGFKVGDDFRDAFISSPVFNFPPEFSGPDDVTAAGAAV